MVRIDPDKPLYTIGVAAELIGVHPRGLRIYEEKEIIRPSRTEGNRRLYSLKDLDVLEYVHYLTHIKKVNIAGVRVILDLLNSLPENMRQKIIDSIEKEIESLSEEKKKVFVEGKEEIKQQIIEEA